MLFEVEEDPPPPPLVESSIVDVPFLMSFLKQLSFIYPSMTFVGLQVMLPYILKGLSEANCFAFFLMG